MMDAQEVEKFSWEFVRVAGVRYPLSPSSPADWRLLVWKPFSEWLRTPRGVYAQMEAEAEHG